MNHHDARGEDLLMLLSVATFALICWTAATAADKEKLNELTLKYRPKYRFILSRWLRYPRIMVGEGFAVDMDEVLEAAKQYWFVGNKPRPDLGRHRDIGVYNANNKRMYVVHAQFNASPPFLLIVTYSYFLGFPTSPVAVKGLPIDGPAGPHTSEETRG